MGREIGKAEGFWLKRVGVAGKGKRKSGRGDRAKKCATGEQTKMGRDRKAGRGQRRENRNGKNGKREGRRKWGEGERKKEVGAREKGGE